MTYSYCTEEIMIWRGRSTNNRLFICCKPPRLFTSMFKNVPSDLLLVRRDAAFQFVVNSPEHGVLHDNVQYILADGLVRNIALDYLSVVAPLKCLSQIK